jgi:hypothetical protein
MLRRRCDAAAARHEADARAVGRKTTASFAKGTASDLVQRDARRRWPDRPAAAPFSYATARFQGLA